MNKKLLILNLGIDSDNTSLAFTQSWVNELSLHYEMIDVITLRVGAKYDLNKNVNLYYINNENTKKTKINQIIDIYKISKKLIERNEYNHCFAHMAPLQHLIAKFLLKKKNIKSTLWFTHKGPNYGIKWIILLFSSLIANNVVTASKNSFPFKFKKVIITGHGIQYQKFFQNKEDFKLKKFLILGRVSKSKNIDNTLENFTKVNNFKEYSIDIIGGTLNKDDDEYFDYLKSKYHEYRNINFLGKKPHDALPEILKQYDVNINNAPRGFFDKAILESAAGGLICFYKSSDFNFLYKESFQNVLLFTEEDLYKKINFLESKAKDLVLESIIFSQIQAEKHSLQNVVTKLINIFNEN